MSTNVYKRFDPRVMEREKVTYRNQRWVTDDAPPPSSEPEPDVNDISDQPEEISSDQTVNIDYTNDDDMMQSVDCNTDNDVYQADNDGPKMHPLSNNVLNASELYSICNVRQTNIHKYSNGTKEQLLHVTRQF